MGSNQELIDPKKLSHWKLLDEFRRRLADAHALSPDSPPDDPRRKLLEKDYFSLVLFGHFNPIIKSMRGLCAASNIRRVQDEVCSRPVSLGSFSEAQGVFDPELLKQVFLGLAAEASAKDSAHWGDPRLAHFAEKLKLVDGTLIPALPRMHWALWVDEKNRAAKLHLQFSVLRQAAAEALITAGNSCERKALLKIVKRGETVVADRYYGLEYGFLEELRQLGVSFVIRIRSNPVIEVVEEMPLTEADRAAGITWQGMVKLGTKWRGEPVRLIRFLVEGKEFLVVTDLDIEAELIALIYRYRWQVELFFKWFKCILGCRHLLAESEEGVAIQIYSALIAALMLQTLTGKRPGKRAMELIQLYQFGYIGLEELMDLLGLEKPGI